MSSVLPRAPFAPVKTFSICGRVSHTLVWALTVASVVLLLPVIILQPPHAPVSEAWLEFVGPDCPSTIFHTTEAPVIRLELGLLWPAEAQNEDAHSTDAVPDEPNPEVPVYVHFFGRIEPVAGPLRSFSAPRHIQYKIDPTFGFENRALHLDGMMINLWFEF